MSLICFYHSSDLDGHCSAAIVKCVYADAVLIPASYGVPFPWDKVRKGGTVFMVDFSLQVSEMLKLNSQRNLIWIDHHKCVIEAMDAAGASIKGRRAVGKAGCELTWEYLYPNKPMPRFIAIMGRYDVWDHSDPTRWEEEILPFEYGMRQYDTDPRDNPDLWDRLFKGQVDLEKIKKDGIIILGYQRQFARRYMRAFAFETTFDGHRAIAVNAGATNSLFFDGLYDHSRHDIMIAYCCRRGQNWGVSLYSDKVDVAAIARKFGGAGHPGAAGFSCSSLPFSTLCCGDAKRRGASSTGSGLEDSLSRGFGSTNST